MANSRSNLVGNLPLNLQSNLGGAGGGPSLPEQGNIVFRHDLYDGVTTPQIGTATYARSGSVVVPVGNGLWQEFSANQLPIGVKDPLGYASLSGAYLQAEIINYALYSEDFTNAAWTAVSGGSATANTTTDPLGTTLGDTITCTGVGSGLQQASARSASSSTFVFTVWLKAISGTPTVRLVVKDQGTQGGIFDCDLTSSWQRFEVAQDFNSGTSTVDIQIISQDAGTTSFAAWGAQLEEMVGVGANRARYGGGDFYVRTTSASATVGNSTYVVPNAIATTIATQGTVSFWVYLPFDPSIDTNEFGENPYAVSIAGETLAVVLGSYYGPALFINGSWTIPASSPSDTDFLYTVKAWGWSHVTASWDTTADVYKMYLDGELIRTTTPTRSSISVGANTLCFGNGSTPAKSTGLDGIISQIVVWDSVLSDADVAQVYSIKSAQASQGAIGTGKIFEVELGTSLIPTVGDPQFRWNGRYYGTSYYYDSTTSIAANNQLEYAKPAYLLNAYNKGGLPFYSKTTNRILQSEDIGTTWVAVGAPVITASAGTFLNNITYGTINGVATEGIEQSSAEAAASDKYTASLFASVASGTLGFTITLEGDSGGTPDSGTSSTFTATTTPQRFDFHRAFTSATGNVRFKVLLTGTGTLRIGGLMLEKIGVVTDLVFNKVGNYYIKTTTTTAETGTGNLVYRAAKSINMRKGTCVAWGSLYVKNPDEFIVPNGPTVLGMPGGGSKSVYFHQLTGRLDSAVSGFLHRMNEGTTTIEKNTWYHYAYTWDMDAVAPLQIYLNGVLQTAVDSGSVLFVLRHRAMLVGGDGNYVGLDTWQGILDYFAIYGDVLTGADILADFNATKAAYGL